MKLAQIDFTQLENEAFINDPAATRFTGKGIDAVIIKLIPYFYTFAGILLLLYLLFGGFQLMTSAGNPKAVEAGKAKITYAFLGFFIVFVSYWIVKVVGLLFDIDVIFTIFT
ncbi:hypothetical protein IPM62_00480 [Candidatus Woesebacteria bacterium]|nr:MAG: hypothetical protein IPM62_00480 [Candidatus Woesebacteria bacterium]